MLDAVKAGDWRVLVGEDALALDTAMRARPTEVYSDEFMAALQAAGHFTNGGGLIES